MEGALGSICPGGVMYGGGPIPPFFFFISFSVEVVWCSVNISCDH